MTARPPRALTRVLELVLAPAEREPVVGDLAEEYARRADARGPEALRWYAMQVVRTGLALGGRRLLRARAPRLAAGLVCGLVALDGWLAVLNRPEVLGFVRTLPRGFLPAVHAGLWGSAFAAGGLALGVVAGVRSAGAQVALVVAAHLPAALGLLGGGAGLPAPHLALAALTAAWLGHRVELSEPARVGRG